MKTTSLCGCFNIPLCMWCKSGSRFCSIDNWRCGCKYDDINSLLKIYNNLTYSKIYFLTALKHFYPIKYEEFNKLIILC
jgi:hypothetical protein